MDAARRLASAGRRAFARGDVPAAANLFGRAAAVLPEDARERLELLPEHGEALLQLGQFEQAEAVLADAIDLGTQSGNPHVAAHASLVQLLVRLRTGEAENWRDVAAETVAEAMAVFEVTEDHAGLAKAWRLLAWTHGTACHFGLAAEASERALEHARAAGDVRQQTRAATAYAAAALYGPTPVDEAIARCELMMPEVSGDRQAEGVLSALLASLLAMSGSSERARELAGHGRAMLEELDVGVEVASARLEAWRVEMFAGDPEAAERELRPGYDYLVEVGEKFFLSTVAGLLGQTLYALDRLEEADSVATLAEELATEEDVDTQALWRCIRAKLLARDGSFERAEALAREAIDVLEPTDAVLFKFGALLDLAEIQRLSGRDGATETLLAARDLAAAKSSPVMARTAEQLLGSLAPS
jgi:tetratricopeptide (TPR) repeat protein